MIDKLPPALREALGVPFRSGNFALYRDRARAMAATLRWVIGEWDAEDRNGSISDAIDALEREEGIS